MPPSKIFQNQKRHINSPQCDSTYVPLYYDFKLPSFRLKATSKHIMRQVKLLFLNKTHNNTSNLYINIISVSCFL